MATVLQIVRSAIAPLTRTRLFRAVGPVLLPPVERLLARLTGGRVQLSGLLVPSLVLHTIGAKSGAPRDTYLMYTADGRGRAIVAGTTFAQERHPGWTYNLLAHPDASITVRGRRMPVRANLIGDDERDAAWARIEAQWPGYRGYGAIRAGWCGCSGSSRSPTRTTRRCSDAAGPALGAGPVDARQPDPGPMRAPASASRRTARRIPGVSAIDRRYATRTSRTWLWSRRGRATAPSGSGVRPRRGTRAIAMPSRASSMSEAKSGSSTTTRGTVPRSAKMRIRASWQIAPVGSARPRLVDEVGAIQLGAACQRMLGREHDVGLVVAHVLGRHVRGGDERHRVPVVHDGEVDHAGSDHLHRINRVDARDRGEHGGLVVAERSQQGSDEAARGRGERGDAQRRGRSRPARRERLEPLESVEQLAPLAREGPAAVGEQHAAAATLEQHRVEVALELLDLLRDSRRRVAEPFGRGDHGAGAIDGDEGAKSLQIDHEAIVRGQANNSELVLH